MRRFTRGLVVSALATPLLLGAGAGIATADSSSYGQESTMAGPRGAWSERTETGSETGHRGGGGDRSHYSWTKTGAGKHGAWTKHIRSDADTRDHRGDHRDGGRGFGFLGGLFG